MRSVQFSEFNPFDQPGCTTFERFALVWQPNNPSYPDLSGAIEAGLDGLRLNSMDERYLQEAIDAGFKVFDVSFDGHQAKLTSMLDSVEGLLAVRGVDNVASHPTLEVLHTSGARPVLPDPAPALRRLRVYRAKELPPINAPVLEHLLLIGYDLPSLDILRGCVGLKYLRIDGEGSDRLVDVSALSGLPVLEQVLFEECPGLDLAGLAGAPSLERLGVYDCGPIADLGFIRELPSLEQVVIRDSVIQDGDLSSFLDTGLLDVEFGHAEHHSHTEHAVRLALEAQQVARCTKPPVRGSGRSVLVQVDGVGPLWFTEVRGSDLHAYTEEIAARHGASLFGEYEYDAPVITQVIDASILRAGRLVSIEVANPQTDAQVAERVGEVLARLEPMYAQAEAAMQTAGHPAIDEYVSDRLDRDSRRQLGVKNAAELRARLRCFRVRLNMSEPDLRPHLDFTAQLGRSNLVLACRFDGDGVLQEIRDENRPGVRLF